VSFRFLKEQNVCNIHEARRSGYVARGTQCQTRRGPARKPAHSRERALPPFALRAKNAREQQTLDARTEVCKLRVRKPSPLLLIQGKGHVCLDNILDKLLDSRADLARKIALLHHREPKKARNQIAL
jgi:hypothetical protein